MNKKRIIGIALSAVMMLGLLGGCGKAAPTVESLATAADKKVSEAKSIESVVQMNMDMGVEVEGFSMNVAMSGDLGVDSVKDPVGGHIDGEMKIAVFGFETTSKLDSYIVKDGDEFITYTGTQTEEDGEMEWVYTKDGDASSLEGVAFNIFGYMKDNKDKFTLAEEKEKFNGTDCLAVSGKIPGDYMKEILSATGSADLIGEEDSDMDMSKLEMDVVAYFDAETQDPVGIHFDCAKGFADMMAGMPDAEGAKVNEFTIDVTYKGFDTIDKIEVPADVKEKAVDADTVVEEDPFDFGDGGEDIVESEVPGFEEMEPVYGDFLTDTAGLNKLAIDGREFVLGGTLADLMGDALAVEDGEPEFVEAGETSLVSLVGKDNNFWMIAYLYNGTDAELAAADCTVYGAAFYRDTMDGCALSIADGMSFDNVKDDFTAKFGTPYVTYSSEYGDTLQWTDEASTIIMDGNFELGTGVMQDVDIADYSILD